MLRRQKELLHYHYFVRYFHLYEVVFIAVLIAMKPFQDIGIFKAFLLSPESEQFTRFG